MSYGHEVLNGGVAALMRLCGYRIDSFHEKLLAFQEGNETTLQLAPRGWGKSTVGVVGNCAFDTIVSEKADILLASPCGRGSEKQIRSILADGNVVKFFGRPALRIVVVDVGDEVDGDFDYVYVDDTVTFRNTRHPQQIEDTIEWFHTSLAPYIGESTFRVLGSRYCPADLYASLQYDPRFQVELYPATTPEGESNNPEIWPTQYFESTRKTMTEEWFRMQYNQGV